MDSRLLLALVAFSACLFVVYSQDHCAYCQNLTCGSDGIGGSCGTCPFGQRCSRGNCVCDRDCSGKQCGPDNCGTNCGECLTGQSCVNNLCVGTCTSQCTKNTGLPKTCGWDRCNSLCGSCPTGFRCKDGTCLCYPNCNNRNCGSDGCGGTCGTCLNDAICQGEGTQFPGNCYTPCFRCGDGVCSDKETSTTTRAQSLGLEYCPQDCGAISGIISLAVGQKDQLNNITIDFFTTNPYTAHDRELTNQQLARVVSDNKGSFAYYNIPLTGGAKGNATRIYFRLRGAATDRTTGNTVPLLDLWWNFELINSDNLNQSPNFYFYMSPYFTDADALFRMILSWGALLTDRGNTIQDVDMFIAGPVDSDTMAASNPDFRNGIVNFANKDYKSQTSGTILPFAKIVADSAQGYGPEVIDVYHDVRIGQPDQSIGISEEYPPAADEVNEYEFWVDRPNSNANADSFSTELSNTNSFIVVYRGSSVGPTVVNQQIFFGDYSGAPAYMFGFYNNDPFNDIPASADAWHVFNLARRELNHDSDLTGVTTDNIFEFRNIPSEIKYVFLPAGEEFSPTKTIPCSHTIANGVPGNLAYCPYTITYPQDTRK